MKDRTLIRITIHAFSLAILNIASIVVAFGVYKAIAADHQILIQTPVAALFSLLGFLGWTQVIALFRGGRYALRGMRELAWIYLVALIWAPALFVCIHFATQGYLTSFGNIVGLWLFQIPANVLVLALAGTAARRSGGAEVQ